MAQITMSRMLRLSLILGALLVSTPSWANGALVISGHPQWPPYSWEKDGRLTGIAVEVTQLILGDLKVPYEVRNEGNWNRALNLTRLGDVDIIAGVYQTKERKAYLRFTNSPLTLDHNVVWIPRGKAFPFKSWSDLRSRHGVSAIGDSLGEAFDDFMRQKLAVDYVTGPENAFRMIAAGRADYFPYSQVAGEIMLSRLGLTEKVEFLPDPITQAGCYIAFSSKSRFLPIVADFNARLAQLVADGTVASLLSKYKSEAAQ